MIRLVRRVLSTIESHTAGEPTRVIIGGLPNIYGKTMVEKNAYFNNHYDHIRKTLMMEPRGSRAMFGVLLTEAVSEEADFGVIFMDASKTVDMCGHASIGLATTAVEYGLVPMKEPITEVKFDTISGLITTKVTVKDGKVQHVTLQGVPSFFYKQATIAIPEYGVIDATISFGGNFFALVEAAQVGLEVIPENVYELIRAGKLILQHTNEQIKITHPTRSDITNVFGVQLYDQTKTSKAHSKNITIGLHSQVDRSPCGTGTYARLAALCSTKEVNIGDEFIYESVIGSTFSAKAVDRINIEGYQAIIPEITASAYITAMSTIIIDPNDPLREGFLLT